jgi:hypothetical protein
MISSHFYPVWPSVIQSHFSLERELLRGEPHIYKIGSVTKSAFTASSPTLKATSPPHHLPIHKIKWKRTYTAVVSVIDIACLQLDV